MFFAGASPRNARSVVRYILFIGSWIFYFLAYVAGNALGFLIATTPALKSSHHRHLVMSWKWNNSSAHEKGFVQQTRSNQTSHIKRCSCSLLSQTNRTLICRICIDCWISSLVVLKFDILSESNPIFKMFHFWFMEIL